MVLSAQEQNVTGFFYHCHRNRLVLEKGGNLNQYIIKASGINKIVIQIIEISFCIITVVVFIMNWILNHPKPLIC